MGGQQKLVENFDRKGFKAYLAKKGMQACKLSESMGWSTNYISEVTRDDKPRGLPLASYKYLCAVLKVSEDKFILKEEEKKTEPSKSTSTGLLKQKSTPNIPPIQVNGGITPGQFNALLQAIEGLNKTLETALDKIATSQNSSAIIQGKIYGEVSALSTALGVKSTTPTENNQEKKPMVTIRPKYANAFGGSKNGN